MTLCQMCEAIPASMFERSGRGWRNIFVHHPSLKSLESSAKGGCNVCSLFFNTIRKSKYQKAYPCGGTAGPDGQKEFEALFSYSGLPQNLASQDGHRTYLKVVDYKEKSSDKIVYFLEYKVGRDGFEHQFDIEFSDDRRSSTLYPLSDTVFSLAGIWIDKCVQTHSQCNIRYDTTFQPTRLIDVGKRGISPRLMPRGSYKQKDLRYATLSHCWGASMPKSGITTISTLGARLSRIPIRNLPRTFRDAISATRKLGLQYIWIDSLCILQDSPEDWQRESALMGKVYSHSFCTFAAAAAEDCHGGLFANNSELPILGAGNKETGSSERLALIKPRVDGWDALFNTSKLNRRGWTLQERELSPRILYFSNHTMLFECREARAGDSSSLQTQNPIMAGEMTSKLEIQVDQKVQRVLDQIFHKDIASRPFHDIVEYQYLIWMSMIEGYSQRQLTVASDKFPGVSGLASEFAFLLDDQYVAGLWRKDLCRGLCWRWAGDKSPHTPKSNNLKAQSMNYGPSWSWANMTVSICYDLVYSRTLANYQTNNDRSDWGEPEFLHVSTVPEGKDPNGTLIFGKIHLRGFLLPATRSKTGNFLLQRESVAILWDFLPQKLSNYYILNLGRTRVGLVLVPSGLNACEYRRVGIIPMTNPEWFAGLAFEELTLV